MINYDALGSITREISSGFLGRFHSIRFVFGLWPTLHWFQCRMGWDNRFFFLFPQDHLLKNIFFYGACFCCHCVKLPDYNFVSLFSVLSSTVLIHVSVSMTVPGYVSYYTSDLHFEITYCDSSNIAFVFFLLSITLIVCSLFCFLLHESIRTTLG